MWIDNLDHQNTTRARPSARQGDAIDVSATTRRIRGEYDEMPGLVLTEAQARRLWGLDSRTCRLVLTVLVRQRFLKRTATGMYVRAS
jgi:hypothetical protein